MRAQQLFLTVLSFLFSTFLFLLGVSLLLFPWAPKYRGVVLFWLETAYVQMSLVGLGFALSGLLLLLGLFKMRQGDSYSVKMGSNTYTIDAELIQAYVQEYWERLFPGKNPLCVVSVKRNRVEIQADLPPVPFSGQRDLLSKAERDLGQLFTETLGYHTEFVLTVSFASQPAP